MRDRTGELLQQGGLVTDEELAPYVDVLLAATPMEVAAVRGGLVHFTTTTASGVRVRLPVQVFRMLFDPVPS